MASFNKVIMAGNLTRSPELRYTPSGTAVCEIGLAVNRQWKDEAGNKKEAVTFVDCTAWAGTAETISKHLRTGDPILVEGRLDLQTWEDKTTKEKRQKHVVTVESFSFIGSKKNDEIEKN
jgi:single-strand DNA-binding protein